MLGRDVSRLLAKAGYEVSGLERRDLDITDADAVEDAVASHAPAWVVNCAAFTRVDDCETRWEEALLVNGTGPGLLAEACARHGAALVHVSTDYVFDGTGNRPYLEDDPVCPVNAYGRSKLAGEEAVSSSGCRYVIVRTAWLFGRNGRNFVDTILGLLRERGHAKVVDDQVGCPTFTRDLAWGILRLMECGAEGIVNVVNSGACTWFQFAQESARLSGMDPSIITPVTSEEFPRPARRPAYSVLDTAKFRRLTGAAMRPWQEGLAAYLESR